MIALAFSSNPTGSTTVRINPYARCHTLLFCALICSSCFRAVTQPKNLETDRVQPASTLPKPPRTEQKNAIKTATQPNLRDPRIYRGSLNVKTARS
jgi:hypothetical protein